MATRPDNDHSPKHQRQSDADASSSAQFEEPSEIDDLAETFSVVGEVESLPIETVRERLRGMGIVPESDAHRVRDAIVKNLDLERHA